MAQPPNIIILTPPSAVKCLKNALERHDKLDKSTKIGRIRSEEDVNDLRIHDNFALDRLIDNGYCRIPTLLHPPSTTPSSIAPETPFSTLDNLIPSLEIPTSLFPSIHLALRIQPSSPTESPLLLPNSTLATKIPRLHHAIYTFLLSLPPSTLPLPLPIPTLLSLLPTTYTIYPPLLLLPSHTFSTPPWPHLLTTTLHPHLPTLYTHLTHTFSTTHLALSAPIPTPSNPLRLPLHLTPLFPPTFVHPTRTTPVLWATTTQHTIHQTFAPQHTMFSRGNIREKHRLLHLPTLSATHLRTSPARTTAVDLFVGIGYFAFCYLKRGVGHVLGWELNGWSVEGARRGAGANGWGVRIVRDDDEDDSSSSSSSNTGTKLIDDGDDDDDDTRLLLFHESNIHATRRVRCLRASGAIGPVRHVNLGLLPHAREAWGVAVEVVDEREGGWLHLHENVGVGEKEEVESTKGEEKIGIEGRKRKGAGEKAISQRKEEVVRGLEDLAGGTRAVQCEHVERVKTFAPGVVHCVFDVWIGSVESVSHYYH